MSYHENYALDDNSQTNLIRSKLTNADDLKDYYEALNKLDKQETKETEGSSSDEFAEPLDRWPTLFEILNKKSKPPVDLWSFYVFMRDQQKSIDYLDFWIDTVQHMNLCKVYVKGLKDSLIVNERVRNADKINQVIGASTSKLDLTQSVAPPSTNFIGSKPFSQQSRNSNRDSNASSRDSKSSSMLLELLMRQNMFEGQDPHRLSTFLRGESAVKSNDPLVNAKIDELKRRSHISGNFSIAPSEEERQNLTRISRINPEMVESLIQSDFQKKDKDFEQCHFITRVTLRKSSQNILNTYFKYSSEKKILIPNDIVLKVCYALEAEGRDDPEVFDEAREYVFKAMEYEAYPNFLRDNAMCNVTAKSSVIRLFLAILCGFAAFWTGYTLIFIDYDPKPTRAVVTLPFFFMSYFFFSSFYKIDPVLCFFGFGESRASHGGFMRLKEPFVKNLLMKRSLFILALICVLAACFSVLFALVPGIKLQR